MVSTKTLKIRNISAQFEFRAGDNLLDILNANKVSIAQSCGGFGSCTTCRVFIVNGAENCSSRSEIELERATERNFTVHERLCCQTQLSGDVEIEIPE